MNKSQVVFYLFILITLSSCVSKKKIIYLQGQQNQSSNQVNYEPIIQNDDLLSITISSVEPELAVPFNLDQLQSASGSSSTSNSKTTYLVDSVGEIDFPVLGKIKVAGLTKTILKQQIKDRLALYLTDPIINIRIVNYKISVLGEVNKPGSFTLNGDRITLLEVIANAGDLTLYGKRDNILIIRDYLGTKTYNRVDITKADFVNSPFYYLDQNDVVYVEPRKARIDGTAIGGNITAIMSIASFLITTTLLLTR
ncbi:polysaccharide biosynthesis/export family protein [Flavobacterium sp.]|uniref:polysaccharide biosynthesis/export family protein n=1 Tax=Flavobacterium sp. TaxID=239 RepID=UPI002B4ABB4C|nr:polysaccharide biosynthesis/export family protein [Flavobacterium sp.]HLP65552.1 polysaccharide biosynthesis/export family protein [Flavobacterium sp.]